MGDDPKVALDAIIRDLNGVSDTREWDALEAIVDRLVMLFRSVHPTLHPTYHISDALNCHVIAFIYRIPLYGDEVFDRTAYAVAIDRTASEFQSEFNQMFNFGVSSKERYEDWSKDLHKAAKELIPGDYDFFYRVLEKMVENHNNETPCNSDSVSGAAYMDNAHVQSISAFFVKLCKDMCTPGRSDVTIHKNTAEFKSLYAEMLKEGWTYERLTLSVRQNVLGNLATVQMLMQSYIAANQNQEVAFRIEFVQCIAGAEYSWEKLCRDHRDA